MKSFPTREIKQRANTVLAAASHGPVALTRYGRRVAVVLSPGQYEELAAARAALRAEALGTVVAELDRHEAMGAGARRLLSALRR